MLMPVSCSKAWRGDGPPKILHGSEWIGTNQARGEILDMIFGLTEDYARSESEDGSTYETGDMKVVFSFPVQGESPAGLRDTISYLGTYQYTRTPSRVHGDVHHGVAEFDLVDSLTGERTSFGMSFHNQRFFVSFRGSSYPADRVDEPTAVQQ